MSFFLVSCQTEAPYQPNLNSRPLTPELVEEGVISTHLYERDFALSPDSREIIYTFGNPRQTVRALVHLRQHDAGTWTQPEILPLSGRFQDIEPFFHPNGKQLFFASDRPVGGDTSRHDYNIWMAEKVQDQWANPTPLPDFINTAGNEFFPAVTDSGHLYFTATRPEGPGREDLYVSRLVEGRYQPPVALDTTVNTAAYEFNAYVSPAEDLLIFSSYGREDDLGGGDLYLSRKGEDGRWQQTVHLPAPVNSETLDYCPFVDQERQVLYFTSERAGEIADSVIAIEDIRQLSERILNGWGNIYRVDLKTAINRSE